MRNALGCLVLAFFASTASAAVPSLVANGDDGSVALALSGLSVRATIRGHLAHTEFELTFRNALDRRVGGEFLFPLPPDAEVSDLGLWFGDTLRHGVAVERVLARKAYDETVHRAVDPALAEWNAGRAFRFSVYPIPARGEKKVFIAYDQELTKNDYELDLRYRTMIDVVDIAIDADGRAAEPSGTLTATLHPRNATLDGTIRVARDPNETALAARSPEDGQWYTSATLDLDETEHHVAPAPRVVILWDASSSGVQQNGKVVRAFLREFLARQPSWAAADVIPFHVDFDVPRRIERAGMTAGTADLERFLDDTPFLGATNLIAVAKNLPAIAASLPPGSRIVLVTDGLTSLGDSHDVAAAFAGLSALGRPLTVVNSSPAADVQLLANIARVTGGWSLDLTQMTADAAVERAMSTTVVAAFGTKGVTPRRVLFAGQDRVHVASKSAQSPNVFAPAMSINNRAVSRELALRELHDPVEVAMVRRAWARARLRELIANGAPDEELIAHGRAYTQLTPRTSLLVLEAWQDYVRYLLPLPPDLAAQKAEDERRWEATRVAQEQWTATHPTPPPMPPPVFVAGGWNVGGTVTDNTGDPLPGVTVSLRDADQLLAATYTDANGRFALGTITAPANPSVTASLEGFNARTYQVAGSSGSTVQLMLAISSVSESITVTAEAPVVDVPAMSAASSAASLRTSQAVTDDLLNRIASEDATADTEDPEVQAEVAKHRHELTQSVVERLKGMSSTPARLRYYLSARSLLGGDKGFHVFAAEAVREKSPEIAARILCDLAEARPDDAPLLRILARVLDGWGEENLARLLLAHALEIAPDQPQSWREMILLEAKHGHPNAVQQWKTKFRALHDDDWKSEEVFVQTNEAIDRYDALSGFGRERGTDVRVEDDDELTIELMYDNSWCWVDVHIVEPSGERVTWNNVTSAAGARFTTRTATVPRSMPFGRRRAGRIAWRSTTTRTTRRSSARRRSRMSSSTNAAAEG